MFFGCDYEDVVNHEYYTLPLYGMKDAKKRRLFEDFNRILDEERGIADDVIGESNRLEQWLYEESSKYKPYYDQRIGMEVARFKSSSFQVFGKETETTVTIFYPYTHKQAVFINQKIGAASGIRFDVDNGKIILDIGIVLFRGRPIEPKFSEILQHEVEHLYQQVMMGKNFSDGIFYSSVNYTKNNAKEELIFGVMYIMYMMEKSEQEGFANGLYRAIMKNYRWGKKSVDDIVYESECTRYLHKMEKYIQMASNPSNKEKVQNILDNLSENIRNSKKGLNISDEELKRIRNKYPTYDKFIKVSQISLEDFKKRIVRVINLAKLRIFKNMDVREEKLYTRYISPNDDFYFEMGRGW